jgi:16S rRNA G966 N2-methylase RsmD
VRPEEPPEPRSSLSQRGGEIITHGEPELAAELAAALAAADSDETQDLTHGFHTYPARMHPRLARELVARFSEPEQVVLDPFCGSGTVLVEALVAGRKPQGVDLNPLALRIAEVHCALRNPSARRRFERLLQHVALASEERVRSRARAHIAIDRETQAFYQPHVLFELCGLRDEIETVPDESDRRALLMVFSALLIKFSRKRADTSREIVEKRIRKGLVTEFFARKGHELNERWEALYEAAPRDAFEARLVCGDSRELPDLLGSRFRADLVLASPPYGGTYDYAHHHALRNAWFGFDTERFEAREIGARRSVSRTREGRARWDDELLGALRAMREVSSDDTHVILWIGDGEVSGQRMAADRQVAELAQDAALALRASASQARQDPRGGEDRMEHILLLEPQPFPRR